jgi:hypothetical protein
MQLLSAGLDRESSRSSLVHGPIQGCVTKFVLDIDGSTMMDQHFQYFDLRIPFNGMEQRCVSHSVLYIYVGSKSQEELQDCCTVPFNSNNNGVLPFPVSRALASAPCCRRNFTILGWFDAPTNKGVLPFPLPIFASAPRSSNKCTM